jgi:cytochrome c553
LFPKAFALSAATWAVAGLVVSLPTAPARAQSASVPAAAPAAPLTPIALEGDPVRGAKLAITCGGCHGVPDAQNVYPTYNVPKLGGQNADYIEVALQGYRRGTRSHPTMQAQAASLSDQDIADIAAYVVSQPGDAEAGMSSASEQEIEEGRRKATACLQCHGEIGVAETQQWPTLAGQHQSYLKQALHQYQSGQRSDVLMGPLVAGLDAETVEQLTAYFSAQPYLHTLERE